MLRRPVEVTAKSRRWVTNKRLLYKNYSIAGDARPSVREPLSVTAGYRFTSSKNASDIVGLADINNRVPGSCSKRFISNAFLAQLDSLACAPIKSELGQRYLGAMRAAVNCALANRQILTHLTRSAFAQFFPDATLKLVYDVSHNICKEETHVTNGMDRMLHVHRKGATRALGPGSVGVPPAFRAVGQPVFIGGSMGTSSYVLAGTKAGEELAFSSACHGAGRRMSRNQARKRWRGHEVASELERKGIIVRSPSNRGIAEEAPGAYKDVSSVVDLADRAGLATKVCRLRPMICIKG